MRGRGPHKAAWCAGSGPDSGPHGDCPALPVTLCRPEQLCPFLPGLVHDWRRCSACAASLRKMREAAPRECFGACLGCRVRSGNVVVYCGGTSHFTLGGLFVLFWKRIWRVERGRNYFLVAFDHVVQLNKKLNGRIFFLMI